jgi:hypothetical protein
LIQKMPRNPDDARCRLIDIASNPKRTRLP